MDNGGRGPCGDPSGVTDFYCHTHHQRSRAHNRLLLSLLSFFVLTCFLCSYSLFMFLLAFYVLTRYFGPYSLLLLETHFFYSILAFLTRNSLFLLETHYSTKINPRVEFGLTPLELKLSRYFDQISHLP